MDNQKVWVVISYNDEGGHDASIIGTFTTEKLAKKCILKEIKSEFKYELDNIDLNKNYRFNKFDSKDITWPDIKNIVSSDLKINKDCRGLSYLGYKYQSCILNKYFI